MGADSEGRNEQLFTDGSVREALGDEFCNFRFRIRKGVPSEQRPPRLSHPATHAELGEFLTNSSRIPNRSTLRIEPERLIVSVDGIRLRAVFTDSSTEVFQRH